MQPSNPASFNHRTERLSTGRTYHFVDQRPANYNPIQTPTLLCAHGFPDLWYGWRFQVKPWVEKGYRVVVPDMLGYGTTDMPLDSDEYSTKKLSDDLAALLDVLGIQKAVIIGHDWGAFTVSRFALWHPDRLLALIILSVPYTPPSPVYIPVEEMARRVKDLAYQVYFSNPQSTAEIENNLPVFVPLLYSQPKSGLRMTREGQMRNFMLGETNADVKSSALLNEQELQYYESQFKRGMFGPLSYYRTYKLRQEEENAAGLRANLRSDLPVLFFWGTEDPTCAKHLIEKMYKFIPKLRDVRVEGCGHWLMLEARDQVTNTVIEWLDESLPVEKVKL